jgi:beta-N-acetylhexosaminidase
LSRVASARGIVLACTLLAGLACSDAATPGSIRTPEHVTVVVREQQIATFQATPGPDPIDLMVRQMSVEDKIGQILLLGFSGPDPAGADVAIVDLRAGGIVYLNNATSADSARRLSEGVQALARDVGLLPLLIAIDHEGGTVQRIRSGVTVSGPNWDVGSLRPVEAAVAAACERGLTHGRELAALGINVNLAPVLDVWDNPRNTVIAQRAYSSDPALVARLGRAYVEAIQAAGVAAVAKHFPGHGSTTEDSHFELPVVFRDWDTLRGHELVPFEAAIRAGVSGVMTAHIANPLLDPVQNRPASLSPVIVTERLRLGLGFEGLAMTDDLGAMQAITDGYDPGEAAVQAFLAGNDVLVIAGPAERQRLAVEALRAAIGDSTSLNRLDASVRRILIAKHRVGLLPDLSVPPTQVATASPSQCAIGSN